MSPAIDDEVYDGDDDDDDNNSKAMTTLCLARHINIL